MAANDISIKGRKVFFLNLSADVKERLPIALREKEYEIYILDDYRYAKNVLREYPESMLFVQIDDHDKNQLTTNQWFNFLNSFKSDESLCSTLVGIISKRMPTSVQHFFMLNLPLAAGFLSIRNITGSILSNLQNVLEINNAKGRRQYVRARCADDSIDYINFTFNGKEFNLKLNDISCAGISCWVSNASAQLFIPNAVLKDMVLKLGLKTSLKCSTVIFTVKTLTEQKSLLVLLLLPNTTETTKNAIRNHVFDVLQNEIDSVAFSRPMDETEYSNEINSQQPQGFLIDAENDASESN